MSNSKNVWDFFEVKYCLNQDSRPDRWVQAQGELSRVKMEGVERFASLPADQPFKSFCLSQYAMLKSFLATGKETLLALEDDALFRDLGHLPAALGALPKDWDILYLGANITAMVHGIDVNPPEPCSWTKHLWRIRRAWTTHCIAYTRKVAQRIVDAYPIHSFEMYDCWLSNNILELSNAFLVNPMVAYQRPGKSDLWGQETDYTGAFVHGDKIMTV